MCMKGIGKMTKLMAMEFTITLTALVTQASGLRMSITVMASKNG